MRSIGMKLFLAFLAVIITGTILVAVLAGQATATEFGQFMFRQNRETGVAVLADHYRGRGSWDGIESASPFGSSGMMGGGRGQGPGPSLGLADSDGRVLVGGAGFEVGEQLTPSDLEQGSPVEVDGEVVGTLLDGSGGFQVLTPAGAEFLSRVNQTLLVAGVGAATVALLLGVVLARALTRPIAELTHATLAVAGGELGRQVAIRSDDEIGQLARAFNQMSADLAAAQDAQRQMTADIAHELRTPLSVILGHAEALRDGMIPATTNNFELVLDEAQQLDRLVEDLRTLSMAEAGELQLNRSRTSPDHLLRRAAASVAALTVRREVSIQSEVDPNLPTVNVDQDRMGQVFANLMDNALRHTPSGGTVTLAAQRTKGGVRFSVQDTGAGIREEDLPHIFERFYRADKSRSRDQGGSGLGLAIARSIVEAHGGRIRVESWVDDGATFIVELPVAPP